jgi:amino acid transporter
VVIGASIIAGISGGGTALVQLIAAIAMEFVAYAFIVFTRSFNSSGSVYGFIGAVTGPIFGFVAAFTLMMVYINFAGGVFASIADEAQPAFASIGVQLPWQVYAIAAFLLVTWIALRDIRFSSSVILLLEGISMALIVVISIIIMAKGGYHGHAWRSTPFLPGGVSLSALGLGIVYSFSSFSGFEAAATLGEESDRPRTMIPLAVGISLGVVDIFEIGVAFVVTNAFPSVSALVASPIPLVSITQQMISPWLGIVVNFAAVISSFGAALACVNGGARILYALSRDGLGPKSLQKVSVKTGAPKNAIIAVSIVSFAFLAGFLTTSASQAVALILTYGADLILVAYLFVMIAALLYAWKNRLSVFSTVIFIVGLLFLLYVIKDTFIPFPQAPYLYDAIAAFFTLVVAMLIPLFSSRFRQTLKTSPLLAVSSRIYLSKQRAKKESVKNA